MGDISGEVQAVVKEQRDMARVSACQRGGDSSGSLSTQCISMCDGCRPSPALLVLGLVPTRLAQGSGRLAAECVPGKVKAKNIPEREERGGA